MSKDHSPDHDDRIEDFYARHGGPGARAPGEGQSHLGTQGWTEYYAVDGHILRCDWSESGSMEAMRYSEIAPGAKPD